MIILDYKDRRPIYEQIIERFKELIMLGILKEDDQLPSVRNLAMELSINPNTIQRAYMELERLGVIYGIKGKGNFVAAGNNVMEVKHMELKANIRECVKKAKELSLNEDELINLVKTYFKEGCKNDKSS